MMIDPISIQRLAQIEMKERLAQAEKNRLWKDAAVSNSRLVVPIAVAIAHYALVAKAAAVRQTARDTVSIPHKRTTAEIPSL